MGYKYNETSLAEFLSQLKKSHKKGRINYEFLVSYVENGIPRYREEGDKLAKGFSRSTLYNRLANPVNLTNVFSKAAFELMQEFKQIHDPDLEDKVELPGVYWSISEFMAIPEQAIKDLKEHLPGYYRTYRPSIGKPDYVVVGILRIMENPKDGALETYERMCYRLGEKVIKQSFKGMVWTHPNEHFFMITTDSNTKSPQNLILRCIQRDNQKVMVLKGSYSGISNKRGGTKIFWSKIYIERLDSNPGISGWRKILRNSVDYKDKNMINPDIWACIDPENDKNLIMF